MKTSGADSQGVMESHRSLEQRSGRHLCSEISVPFHTWISMHLCVSVPLGLCLLGGSYA